MATKTKPVMHHRPGSRKERVHREFSAKGADAALKLGSRLRLKKTTLRAWFSGFRRTRLAPVTTHRAAAN